MATIVNGKTDNNIIRDMTDFTKKVVANGGGMIAGSRYHTSYTYWDMSDVVVEPNNTGDDMYMVNYHNDMSYEMHTEDDLRNAIIAYLNAAIDLQKSSKATVKITRNDHGLYELDNMRMYESLDQAKKNGHANRSEYVYAVGSGKTFPL